MFSHDQVEGKLPKPVVVNSVSTNGVWWEMASFQVSTLMTLIATTSDPLIRIVSTTLFQLNSLDMQSDVKNLFFHHPDSMKLIDFCGYR